MCVPNVPIYLNTSENNLDTDFFLPCLKWATRYDRGVGYFTSGWIAKNAIGMAEFACNNGRARWIISPMLEEKDYLVIRNSPDMHNVVLHYQNLLESNIEQLAEEIEFDTQNALGWMIYDNIIELRFAIPTQKLLDGDFHDKFGTFSDEKGNFISFTGSINDSIKGFSNYESIKVFKSWEGMLPYIKADTQRFEKLWNNNDDNLRVVVCNDAIREKLIRLRKSDRPYKRKKEDTQTGLWRHQDEAVTAFLHAKNGILEMATGTGKTRTAYRLKGYDDLISMCDDFSAEEYQKLLDYARLLSAQPKPTKKG